ncbi:MAG: Ig-like domain-containing protein [Bacteroidales bacterium]|nr:Ig-like domain-containing protein [Bacteroidales bacterium]MDY2935068.1 Ig-like domain-containing protein [Candidatus Cryptobacteroides sp.]
MKKLAFAFMAFAMAVLSMTGCGKTEPNEPEKPAAIKVTGVTLDRQSLSMTEGENSTLTATLSPSNATDKSVTWSSSSTAVAMVDGNGKVTAVKAGEATVTVTTKGRLENRDLQGDREREGDSCDGA